MDKKLTLKLDQEVIEQAKEYAHSRNMSLSKMVEKYFRSLATQEQPGEESISPLVKELSGIISEEQLDKLRNSDSYYEYLMEKHK